MGAIRVALALAAVALGPGCGGEERPAGDAGAPDAGGLTLAAPTGLSAAAGDAQVALSWNPVDGADGYHVGRAGQPGDERVVIASVTTPGAADLAAENGVTYRYAVRAYDSEGEGPWSEEVSATPQEAAPAAPSGVTAIAGRTKVTISWQGAADADDYQVRRAGAAGGPYAAIATVTEPLHLDLDVVDGTTYYYVVVARNAGGQSAPSTEVSARPSEDIPAIPTDLAILDGREEVTVSWSPAAAATAYLVERAIQPTGPYAVTAVVTGLSYTERELYSNPSYWYRVRGVGPGGAGDPAGAVRGEPDPAHLAAPWNLRARPGRGAVTLTWTPREGATSYTVLRAAEPAGPYAPVATVSLPYHTDTGLTDGEAAFYVVRTANRQSANSREVAATPRATLPARPAGLAAYPGYGAVTLVWEPVAGASRYIVRRSAYPTGALHVVGEPEGPSFHDEWPETGEANRYTVAAVIDEVEGPWASEVVATPTWDLRPAPTVSARAGADRIALAWTLPAGATEIEVRRAAAPGGPYAVAWAGLGTTFRDDEVTSGARIYYRVRVSAGAVGAWSEEVSAEPSAALPLTPSGLSASAGHEWVELAWDPVPGARGYVVYRHRPGQPPARRASVEDTSFLDRHAYLDVNTPATYVYSVAAYGDEGEGATSDEVAVPMTGAGLARPPTIVQARAGDGMVALRWAGAVGAAAYEIARSSTPGGPYTAIDTTVSYERMVPADNETTYHYVVRALAPDGAVSSAEVTATASAAPPDAPVVTARAGRTHVELSWPPVERAFSYRVYRSTAAGGPYELLFTTLGTQESDTSLEPGTTYHYQVAAVSSSGADEGDPSDEVSATPAPDRPLVPSLFASWGNAEAHLAWTAVPEATAYRVWRADWPEGPYALHAEVASSPFVDPAPGAPGRYYKVSAVTGAGESAWSPIRSAHEAREVMPRVEGLAVDVAGGGVIARWLPVGGATRYAVCTAPEPGSPVRSCVETTRPSASLTGWTAGEPLSIWVRAGGPPGDLGAPGDEVIVTPVGGAPPVPSVTVQPGNREAQLSWSPVAGATGYRVWRADGPDRPMGPLALVDGLALRDGDLRNGTGYTWAVSAVGAGGESGWSSEGTVTPTADWHPGPASAQVRPGAGAVTLDLGAAAGDPAYQVSLGPAPTGPFTEAPATGHGGLLTVPLAGAAHLRITASHPLQSAGPALIVPVAPDPDRPAAPAGLDLREGNGEISVIWDPVPGATGYRVYRASLASDEELAPIAVVSSGPFTDRGLANEIEYRYTVAALGPAGEGAPAPPAWTRASARRRWAPTALTATGSAGAVSLTWTASPGATSYAVCRRQAGDSYDWATCTSTAATNHVDTGLTAGVTYHYVVHADGALSAEVSATAD